MDPEVLQTGSHNLLVTTLDDYSRDYDSTNPRDKIFTLQPPYIKDQNNARGIIEY